MEKANCAVMTFQEAERRSERTEEGRGAATAGTATAQLSDTADRWTTAPIDEKCPRRSRLQ
jgi:hypothetical protein